MRGIECKNYRIWAYIAHIFCLKYNETKSFKHLFILNLETLLHKNFIEFIKYGFKYKVNSLLITFNNK